VRGRRQRIEEHGGDGAECSRYCGAPDAGLPAMGGGAWSLQRRRPRLEAPQRAQDIVLGVAIEGADDGRGVLDEEVVGELGPRGRDLLVRLLRRSATTQRAVEVGCVLTTQVIERGGKASMRLKQRRSHDAKMRRLGGRRKGARNALFLGFLFGLGTDEGLKTVEVPVTVQERQVLNLLLIDGALGRE